MPRPYRLGERATQVEATRLRILDAAIDLYTEVGISATTMGALASRADVAPGTLRNHFPTRDALDRAMVERLTADIAPPDRSIFEGAHTMDQRLASVIGAGAVFIEQARGLYRMWQRERMLTAPWVEKGAEYGARWDELMRIALGPLADDAEAMAVLRAVIQPEFFDSLQAGGRSADAASTLAAAVVSPWFAERARAASAGGPQTR